MHVEDGGLIYDAAGRPGSERIAFFPSLCALRSGVLLAGFQCGSRKHAPDSALRLCRSTDGGKTWQELSWRFPTVLERVPGSLAAAELVEASPGRVLLFSTWFDRSDPDRPLFDPSTEGILRSRQLLSISSDDGLTWSPWRVLPTPGLTGCATTGPVVQWSDGAIAYAFESFKEYDEPGPARHAAWLIVSRDGGMTFDPPQLVARDPDHAVYYWDQRLCPTATPGEFIALFWTHDRKKQRDRQIHLLRGSVLNRHARSPPVETTLEGQIAAPLFLDERRLLAFLVNRNEPGTLELWLSSDGGLTWPEGSRVIVHHHLEQADLSQGRERIDFKAYWEDMGKWSFGHPVIRRLSSERVLLAYYAGTPDRMSIHWARIRL